MCHPRRHSLSGHMEGCCRPSFPALAWLSLQDQWDDNLISKNRHSFRTELIHSFHLSFFLLFWVTDCWRFQRLSSDCHNSSLFINYSRSLYLPSYVSLACNHLRFDPSASGPQLIIILCTISPFWILGHPVVVVLFSLLGLLVIIYSLLRVQLTYSYCVDTILVNLC